MIYLSFFYIRKAGFRMIEVIVQNKADAIKAEEIGADRIELVKEIDKGGLTPNLEVVKEILGAVRIPVQVMVRPHDKHFYYDNKDAVVIKDTAKELVEIGATNIVFGGLTKEDKIDEQLLDGVLNISSAIRLTFHRAFDAVMNLDEAYDTLCNYSEGVERILTSGGAASCMQGKETIKRFVEKAEKINGPVIMPGGGLTTDNFTLVHSVVKADEYHFGSGIRINGSFEEGFDNEFIEKLRSVGL